MFEKIMNLIKKVFRLNNKDESSKDAAKERLHLVLIQDRASVSADFLEVMKQEIIDVIKKYIEIDENAIDVRLTNNVNEDGKGSSPALYANFPITNVKTKILKDNEKPTFEISKKDELENVEENVEIEKVNSENAVSNVEEKSNLWNKERLNLSINHKYRINILLKKWGNYE